MKIQPHTKERTVTFHTELNMLTSTLDRAIENAGPMKGDRFRIIAKDGGYQLEEQSLFGNGWQWKKVAWASNRKAIDEAKRIRQ